MRRTHVSASFVAKRRCRVTTRRRTITRYHWIDIHHVHHLSPFPAIPVLSLCYLFHSRLYNVLLVALRMFWVFTSVRSNPWISAWMFVGAGIMSVVLPSTGRRYRRLLVTIFFTFMGYFLCQSH